MKLILSLLFTLFVFELFAQNAPQGLLLNAPAPEFAAKDQHGNEISLTSLKQKGPVVVVFYRGNWCPYCNGELKKLQDSLEFITATGATVVAISPEAADGVDETIKKTGASFSVLHDVSVKIAKAYDVSYEVDEKTRTMYLDKWNVDFLKTNNQKDKAILPVPAVYIINKEGKISYCYFNKDITKRPSVKELIDNLK
jgi:peroxiredoxin